MTTKEVPQDTIQAVAWRVEFDGKLSFAEKDPRAFWPKAEPLGLLSDIRSLSEANAALEVELTEIKALDEDGSIESLLFWKRQKEAAEAALSAATLEIERLKGALEPDDARDLLARECLFAAQEARKSNGRDTYSSRILDKAASYLSAIAASKAEAAEQRSHDLEGGK